MELFEGQIISAPFLKHKAEIKKFEKKAGFYLLEVVLVNNREYKPLRITEEQLNQITIERGDQYSYSIKSEEFFFWIEANRLRIAYQFDPLLAVNVSQVDPLPHQIEAVYSFALRDPKIRFLIADDAGAGKTIMAGLILKELQFRNLVNNILIVAPGHLIYQWQREMKTKFKTHFTLVNRALMESHWGENVWDIHNQCVASIDFLKQDDILQKLRTSTWDLVIVDEAHKMSAYGYHTRKGLTEKKTQRYRVGEVLSSTSTHMLFLTATPHRGDEENFRLFLDLLRPGFFAKTDLLRESIEHGENPLFIRRLKEDMKDFAGNKLFPPRHVKTPTFPLTDDEKRLYHEVTSYVKVYFDKAKEKRSITFMMMMLQRRLTSSTYAILRSLENRKERLEGLLELPDKIRQDKDYEIAQGFTEEEIEDMDEEERWRIEEKLLHLTLAKNLDEVKMEIEQIGKLIIIAKKVKEMEIESKLVKLRDEILSNLGDKKLLIFTEFKDTLFYLEEKLTSWGYKVNTIHGSMNMDSRIEAENRFKNETQIMVATEAAGEGINLQFCSIMVNYDLPWNPNRLEQRMGRIHRYGQDKEVFIYNLVSKDTREGQVLERLFEKLEQMRVALTSDRVFDVIGEVIPGTSLEELLRDAITGQRRMEEIYDIMEEINPIEMEKTIENIFMTSLATKYIDYSGMMQRLHEADENRLMPEYVEDYFLRAFMNLDGTYTKRDGNYQIKSVPFELRKMNDNYDFKTRFGTINRTYDRITFEKEIAKKHPEYEFIAPGHPLLESINQRIIDTMGDSETVAVFGDETNSLEGVIWFLEGEILDGLSRIAGRRIFSIFQGVRGERTIVNPSILWDLLPTDGVILDETLKRMFTKRSDVEEFVITELMFPFREEINDRRRRESEIKRKYGLRSLDFLLQESNDKLLHYRQDMDDGKDMGIAIINEERRREDLEIKRRNLEEEINLETQLIVSETKLLGAAVVLPIDRLPLEDKTRTQQDMVRDEEIERIGMEVAMQYEIDNGWAPEDVHNENLGFDIRSRRFDEEDKNVDIRYIEVKARAQDGAIRLSANEWKKAKRFQDKY